MGFAKHRMMELEARGLGDGHDGAVCADCIDDPVLADFIRANAAETECDYCGRSADQPIACTASDVAEVMAATIGEEWTDPADELPYETKEGGYQGEVLDGRDLLELIGFEPRNADLFDDIASFFCDHDWCRVDYFGVTPSERWQVGWRRFCSEVMHHRRYTFWSALDDGHPEHDPDYLPPGVMLHEIRDVVQGQNLIRKFDRGTKVWRVQEHDDGQVLEVPSRFTSPPTQFAVQPNRMSPAGIPMFYGAEDFATAEIEVCGPGPTVGRAASGVQFEACRDLWLLDLVYLGEAVSYFAPGGRDAWHQSEFLRYFARDLSKPISRDGMQHIDYVPTQAFTEFVRFHMPTPVGLPLDGIRYPSSRDRRPCYVLFLDQADCLESRAGRPQSLSWISGSLKTVRSVN